jgi:hypothetical protein
MFVARMKEINEQTPGTAEQSEMTLAQFWERTYLPFAKENLRPSTVSGYEQVWNQPLKTCFHGKALKEYRTHMGSIFLTALAKSGLVRSTLAHVRSLACGIFTR